MPRARKGAARHQAKVRWFRLARGNRGTRRNCWRRVKEAVVKAGVYAYRDRRRIKRDYRRLWITRLNAACRQQGVRYSEFIHQLQSADIELDRKTLSELAISDPRVFDEIVTAAASAA